MARWRGIPASWLRLTLLLLPACSSDPASPPDSSPVPAGPEPIPVVEGTLTVRSPAGPRAGEDGAGSLVFELGCGTAGRLELALWDRRGREEGPATRTILGPTGRDVRAGERLTLRFDWRVRTGESVLDDFVRPIGGEEAVSALEGAGPDFASARLAFVRLTTSDSVTSEISRRFAGGSAPPPSGGYRTHDLPLGEGVVEIRAGEEAVLFAAAWLGPEHLADPEAHEPGTVAAAGTGFRAGTETVDASRHAGPFWTLRARLVPAGQ